MKKHPIYTIEGHSLGFSLDSIRKRYSNKEDFFADIIASNEKINKARLKKVLDKVWNEAFPQEETNEKGAE